MKHRRPAPTRRRLRTVGVAAVACTVLCLAVLVGADPPRGEAVVGGSFDPSKKAWAALITYSDVNGPHTCSGSLISERWILTAAHCARPKTPNTRATDQYTRFGTTVRAAAYRVYLGALFAPDPKTALTVDTVWADMPKWARNGFSNDVALLRLSRPAPASLSPLPLTPATTVAADTPVVFSGWGRILPGTGSDGSAGRELLSTDPGDWRADRSCGVPRNLCYSADPAAQSYPTAGDSGAPATALVRGSWLQIGVYSGDTGAPTFSRRTGASVPAYADTIRKVTGLAALPRNKVVKQQGSTASWFVDGDGFRRSVPDGGTYNCLVAKYGAAVTTSRYDTLSAPEDTAQRATCTGPTTPAPGPVGTPTFVPTRVKVGAQTALTVRYTNGSDTPMDRVAFGIYDDNQARGRAFDRVAYADRFYSGTNWCAGMYEFPPQPAYMTCEPYTLTKTPGRLQPGETLTVTIPFRGTAAGEARLGVNFLYQMPSDDPSWKPSINVSLGTAIVTVT